MKKTIRIIIILLLLVIIGGSVLGLSWYKSGIGAVDSNNTEDIVVNVPSGSGATTILNILDENGLVRDNLAGKIFLKLKKYTKLQANTYVLNKSMTLEEIFNVIDSGDYDHLLKAQFTVIEGSTIPQAAEKIASSLDTLSKDDLLNKWSDKSYLSKLIDEYWFLSDNILKEGIMFPLEGYLYPETYSISTEVTAESVTKILLDKMDKELSERKDKIEAMGMTIHEFISLDSVVESESLFDVDKPIISEVFLNRIEKGMPLQSDITVLYALQEKRVNVTLADLKVDFAYNTYKYTGIPIGPVCSVTKSTMDALINHDSNDYLYFFAKEDGTVIYSKTLEEHNKAVKDNLWY